MAATPTGPDKTTSPNASAPRVIPDKGGGTSGAPADPQAEYADQAGRRRPREAVVFDIKASPPPTLPDKSETNTGRDSHAPSPNLAALISQPLGAAKSTRVSHPSNASGPSAVACTLEDRIAANRHQRAPQRHPQQKRPPQEPPSRTPRSEDNHRRPGVATRQAAPRRPDSVERPVAPSSPKQSYPCRNLRVSADREDWYTLAADNRATYHRRLHSRRVVADVDDFVPARPQRAGRNSACMQHPGPAHLVPPRVFRTVTRRAGRNEPQDTIRIAVDAQTVRPTYASVAGLVLVKDPNNTKDIAYHAGYDLARKHLSLGQLRDFMRSYHSATRSACLKALTQREVWRAEDPARAILDVAAAKAQAKGVNEHQYLRLERHYEVGCRRIQNCLPEAQGKLLCRLPFGVRRPVCEHMGRLPFAALDGNEHRRVISLTAHQMVVVGETCRNPEKGATARAQTLFMIKGYWAEWNRRGKAPVRVPRLVTPPPPRRDQSGQGRTPRDGGSPSQRDYPPVPADDAQPSQRVARAVGAGEGRNGPGRAGNSPDSRGRGGGRRAVSPSPPPRGGVDRRGGPESGQAPGRPYHGDGQQQQQQRQQQQRMDDPPRPRGGEPQPIEWIAPAAAGAAPEGPSEKELVLQQQLEASNTMLKMLITSIGGPMGVTGGQMSLPGTALAALQGSLPVAGATPMSQGLAGDAQLPPPPPPPRHGAQSHMGGAHGGGGRSPRAGDHPRSARPGAWQEEVMGDVQGSRARAGGPAADNDGRYGGRRHVDDRRAGPGGAVGDRRSNGREDGRGAVLDTRGGEVVRGHPAESFRHRDRDRSPPGRLHDGRRGVANGNGGQPGYIRQRDGAPEEELPAAKRRREEGRGYGAPGGGGARGEIRSDRSRDAGARGADAAYGHGPEAPHSKPEHGRTYDGDRGGPLNGRPDRRRDDRRGELEPEAGRRLGDRQQQPLKRGRSPSLGRPRSPGRGRSPGAPRQRGNSRDDRRPVSEAARPRHEGEGKRAGREGDLEARDGGRRAPPRRELEPRPRSPPPKSEDRRVVETQPTTYGPDAAATAGALVAVPEAADPSTAAWKVDMYLGGTRLPVGDEPDCYRKSGELDCGDIWYIDPPDKLLTFAVADTYCGGAGRRGTEEYAQELTKLAAEAVTCAGLRRLQVGKPTPPPAASISYAWQSMVTTGSCALALLTLDPITATLHAWRLGSPGFVVLRPNPSGRDMEVVPPAPGRGRQVSRPWRPFSESRMQRDHPRGLGTSNQISSSGSVEDLEAADCTRTTVQAGDVVLAATDGFFHAVSLWGGEGADTRQRIFLALEAGVDPAVLAHQLAVEAKQRVARDPAGLCPYNTAVAEMARRRGAQRLGNIEPDDIAIVMAFIIKPVEAE